MWSRWSSSNARARANLQAAVHRNRGDAEKQEVQRQSFPRSPLVTIPGASHNDPTGARAGAVIPVLADYFAALEP